MKDLTNYLMGKFGQGLGFALIPSLLVCFVLGRQRHVLILIGAIAGMIVPLAMLYRDRLGGGPIDQAISVAFAASVGALIGLAFYPLKNSWFGPPKS